jgi:hypothetical protein
MAMSLTIGESKIVIKQVSLDATTAGPQVGSENPAGCDHSLAPRAEVEQLREAETSEGGHAGPSRLGVGSSGIHRAKSFASELAGEHFLQSLRAKM